MTGVFGLLSGQVRQLIVDVEMRLEDLATDIGPSQQLLFDFRFPAAASRVRNQSRLEKISSVGLANPAAYLHPYRAAPWHR
jgi:hypothetical protein